MYWVRIQSMTSASTSTYARPIRAAGRPRLWMQSLTVSAVVFMTAAASSSVRVAGIMCSGAAQRKSYAVGMKTVYSCRTKGGTAKIVQGQTRWRIHLGEAKVDGGYPSASSAMTALAGMNIRYPAGVVRADWAVPSGASGWVESTLPDNPDEAD